MKKLLLPLIMLIVGTGGGVGAAIFLSPEPTPGGAADSDTCDATEKDCGEASPVQRAELEEKDQAVEQSKAAQGPVEFAKMANQFVIPVVTDAEIEALVVISLGIEVPEGQKDPVFAMEPKLRDRFMQVLFNHANIGGFSGNFTSNENMRILRADLHRSARELLGDVARDILILEIVRQDA